MLCLRRLRIAAMEEFFASYARVFNTIMTSRAHFNAFYYSEFISSLVFMAIIGWIPVFIRLSKVSI